MPVVTPDDIADLVLLTLNDLDRLNFEQIAQNLQDYTMMSRWLKNDHINFDDGIGIVKNLMNNLQGAAAHTGITDTDSVDIPDLMKTMRVPWVHAQTKWGYHYQTDVLMNRGKSMIVKVIEPRRLGAMVDLAEELEVKAWTLKAFANETEPLGVPAWVVFTDQATAGFVGTGLPSGYTSLASMTDFTNFKNWSSKYTTVSKTDLIPKMRTGHRKTRWRSPVTKAEMESSLVENRRYYMNETTTSSMESIGEAQNENLGRDVAPYTVGTGNDVRNDGGFLTFRKHPMEWVPQLDDTAVFTSPANPIYQIDHGVFKVACLKGDYLREGKPIMAPNQHNFFRIFVDITYAIYCFNRRKLAVYATGA